MHMYTYYVFIYMQYTHMQQYTYTDNLNNT